MLTVACELQLCGNAITSCIVEPEADIRGKQMRIAMCFQNLGYAVFFGLLGYGFAMLGGSMYSFQGDSIAPAIASKFGLRTEDVIPVVIESLRPGSTAMAVYFSIPWGCACIFFVFRAMHFANSKPWPPKPNSPS